MVFIGGSPCRSRRRVASAAFLRWVDRTPATYCCDVASPPTWYHLYRFTLGQSAPQKCNKRRFYGTNLGPAIHMIQNRHLATHRRYRASPIGRRPERQMSISSQKPSLKRK